LIEATIRAKLKLIDENKKQEFINQVNEEKTVEGSPTLRLNWLNPDEERRLKWLYETSNQTKIVTVEKSKPITSPKTELKKTSEPIEIKSTNELTLDLAHSNPKEFKQSALQMLKEKYPHVYEVWQKLCDEGLMNIDRLSFPSETWTGEADLTKKHIIVDAQQSPQDIKYRIFEDQRFSYQDEIIYKLSHEISHHLTLSQILNDKDRRLSNLFESFLAIRQQNNKLGFSALGSHQYYQGKGPEAQATEDLGELVNMYLQDPAYFKRYLDFISNPANENQIKKVGVLRISPESAKNAFNVVESIVNNYLQPEETVPLSIKIIDHSEKPVDSALIKQIADQPVIVRVTDLPEKKLVINLDQTAFDIIGDPSRFLKTSLTEKISASKLVPLPSLSTQEEQFFYFTVAKHNDDNTVSYSNCFVSNKNGVYQPVGHIDYTTKENDPSKGICHMSNLHEILQSTPIDKLPPHLKAFQLFFSDNIRGVAVEINNEYRSQKLGKALWYFTLAQSEFDGLKEVEIVGDITVYNDPLDQARSFYQHLGAQPQLYFQYDPGQDKVKGSERLVASSFLDITQISKIKELLEPIKITIS